MQRMNHGKHRHSKQTCYDPQALERDAVRKQSREREMKRAAVHRVCKAGLLRIILSSWCKLHWSMDANQDHQSNTSGEENIQILATRGASKLSGELQSSFNVQKREYGEGTYLGLFEWTCKYGYGCRCCLHQTWSHKRCDWSWPDEGPLLPSPQVPLEEADCPCWHGDWAHGSGCTYGGCNMLPLPGSTRQKATWTPPSRATSAETWFLSPTPTLQTAEGLTGGFLKKWLKNFYGGGCVCCFCPVLLRESLEGVQMQQRSTEKMKKRRKRRWREPEGEGEHRDTLETGQSSVYSI